MISNYADDRIDQDLVGTFNDLVFRMKLFSIQTIGKEEKENIIPSTDLHRPM